MVLVLVILVITGQFHIDDGYYPDRFGINYSALKGLPAYYNPLWQSILATEGISLVLLPFLLFLFRRKLRLPILPWLLTVVITILGIVVLRPVISGVYPFDDTVDSTFKWFIYIELVVVAGVLLGQWAYSKWPDKHSITH